MLAKLTGDLPYHHFCNSYCFASVIEFFAFHDFSASVPHYSSPPFQFFLCSAFLTAGLCPFLPDTSLPNAVFPLLHGVWHIHGGGLCLHLTPLLIEYIDGRN